MQLCKNGSIREDYEVTRRSDGQPQAVMFVTSAQSAITAFLTTRGYERHDGERARYVAHPKASECVRQEFIRRALALRQTGFKGVIKITDLPPENSGRCVAPKSSPQLGLDFSAEEF